MTDSSDFKAFGPDLQTPADLLGKLEYDFRRLKENPRDTYAAFDFFVTAEHMVDWVGNKSLRVDVPLLRIVSHLATGAKHFNVDKSRHESVSGVDVKGGRFGENEFGTVVFGAKSSLVISLMGEEVKLFGRTIRVTELACKVMVYWRNFLRISNDINQPESQ
jgi:hypothetical protein